MPESDVLSRSICRNTKGSPHTPIHDKKNGENRLPEKNIKSIGFFYPRFGKRRRRGKKMIWSIYTGAKNSNLLIYTDNTFLEVRQPGLGLGKGREVVTMTLLLVRPMIEGDNLADVKDLQTINGKNTFAWTTPTISANVWMRLGITPSKLLWGVDSIITLFIPNWITIRAMIQTSANL